MVDTNVGSGQPKTSRTPGSSPGGAQSEGLYNQAKDVLGDAAETASAAVERTYEQGGRLYRQGSRAVSNTDLTPAIIAFAAGYLAAWMIHGQQSKEHDHFPSRRR